MYVCMYVCMHVCMYVCIYIHTHTHTAEHVCSLTGVQPYLKRVPPCLIDGNCILLALDLTSDKNRRVLECSRCFVSPTISYLLL